MNRACCCCGSGGNTSWQRQRDCPLHQKQGLLTLDICRPEELAAQLPEAALAPAAQPLQARLHVLAVAHQTSDPHVEMLVRVAARYGVNIQVLVPPPAQRLKGWYNGLKLKAVHAYVANLTAAGGTHSPAAGGSSAPALVDVCMDVDATDLILRGTKQQLLAGYLAGLRAGSWQRGNAAAAAAGLLAWAQPGGQAPAAAGAKPEASGGVHSLEVPPLELLFSVEPTCWPVEQRMWAKGACKDGASFYSEQYGPWLQRLLPVPLHQQWQVRGRWWLVCEGGGGARWRLHASGGPMGRLAQPCPATPTLTTLKLPSHPHPHPRPHTPPHVSP